MRISVIMAVYNGKDSIAKAIESILNQTYKDFEFIIIDDNSSDNSYEIIKMYANRDKRIKVIRNKFNVGLAKSLNYAIKLADGKYIARQDHDDFSLPERLRKQIDFLESNPDYVFCGCNVKLKESESAIVNFFEYEKIFENQIIENCFAHPTILIKRQIFENYGYYNEKLKYGQDFETWCRLIYKYKLKAKNLKEKLVIYNKPSYKNTKKNKQKLLISLKNQIFTTIKYLKYTENKFRAIKSIMHLLTYIFYVKLFYVKLK